MVVGFGRGYGRGLGGRGVNGRGRMGGLGPEGTCKCPKCGYEEPKIRGQPCVEMVCPKCGTKMIRGQ